MSLSPAHSPDTLDQAEEWKHSTCFSTSVRRADRALTRIYDEALRSSGLSTTQYSLLSLVARAPHRMSISEIAEIQAMDRTTLSRDLNPLVRDGLIEIVPGKDRRRRLVTPTPAGQAAIAIARPLWKAAQDRIASEQGLIRIEHLLEELAEVVARVR